MGVVLGRAGQCHSRQGGPERGSSAPVRRRRLVGVAALLARALGDRWPASSWTTAWCGATRPSGVRELFEHAFGCRWWWPTLRSASWALSPGVTDPEQKRKIIGREFVTVFDAEAAKIDTPSSWRRARLYPDVIESVSFRGPSAVIKTHHNVGGLPGQYEAQAHSSPCASCSRTRCACSAPSSACRSNLCNRQPFPGGPAWRCASWAKSPPSA